MKNLIQMILLILVLTFCLSSCSNSNIAVKSWDEDYGELTPPVHLSAETNTKKVNKNEIFEIKIGMGHKDIKYTSAVFTINSSSDNIAIISPDGNAVMKYYSKTFTDFDVDKYLSKQEDGDVLLNYFETYKFVYTSTDDNGSSLGSISFALMVPEEEVPESENTISKCLGASVTIYYEVKNGKLKLTKEKLSLPNI